MQAIRKLHGHAVLGLFLSALISSTLLGCGGGGGSSGTAAALVPTSHSVNISWAANRETEVNKAGGGYIVAISGMPAINVPYASGVAAPTSVTTTLMSGNYTVTITAYSALNPPGGTTGSTSAASTAFSFSVPY